MEIQQSENHVSNSICGIYIAHEKQKVADGC